MYTMGHIFKLGSFYLTEFSFSYGISVFYPQEDKSIDDLVKEADMKMYEMKKIKNKEGE